MIVQKGTTSPYFSTFFHENAHTYMRHDYPFNKNGVVDHVNPDQVPIIAMDQPIFALGKQLQWTMSDIYGEDRYCYHGWFTHRDDFIDLKVWVVDKSLLTISIPVHIRDMLLGNPFSEASLDLLV